MKTQTSTLITLAVIAACWTAAAGQSTAATAQSTATAAQSPAATTRSTAAAAQRNAANDRSDAVAGFEKLKSLAGKWRSVGPDGRPVDVSYEIVSTEKALLETLAPADEPTMVTVYHLDGQALAVTHYCSSGNQPRLRAEVPPGDIAALRFTFLDATNMARPSEGHIHALTLTFLDDDHVTQAWTWLQDGKAMQTIHELERRKGL